MKFSNKLDLDEFFFNVTELEYVIIKKSEDFPNYYARSDVDILCMEGNEFARKILEIGNKYVKKGFEIKVKDLNEKNKIVIDFCRDSALNLIDDIDFRFDITTAIPNYSKIKVKPFFFNSIIDRRIKISRKFKDKNYSIYVPSQIDDLLLRYFEYLEWYERRPDKIKHLHYIEDNLNTEIKRNRFFQRLYIYTELPKYTKTQKFHLTKKIYRSFIFYIRPILNTPLKEIPSKIIKRIKKIIKRG